MPEEAMPKLWGGMGSTVSSAVDFLKFLAQQTLLNRMKNEFVPYAPNLPLQFAYDVARLSHSQIPAKVLSRLASDYDYLVYAWITGLQTGIGGSFASFQEQFLGSDTLLYAYSTLQYQTSVVPRMRRYWNSEFTPNVPDMKLAFRMLAEGQISRAEFNEYLKYEGWATSWHDKIYNVLDKDPDEWFAFSMYKRGIITEADLKRYLSMAGYDSGLHTKLIDALHRIPSMFDLMRLADFVPLSDLWITEVLRANGFKDGDINYIAPAIRMRPLREEIRSVVGRYLWQRQIGRIDADTLTENLEALGLLPKEVELNVLWGELRYQDELIDEELAIIEAKAEKGQYATQEAILEDVIGVGVLEEKANLIAELWYWKYIA